MKNEKYIFFCYGSLKKGFHNHHVLGNPKFLGEFTTEPIYTLFNGGFPIIERDGNTAIKGELYELENDYNIQSVFDLEGCSSRIKGDSNNWYDYDFLSTDWGKAIIFVMNKGKSKRTNILESGIWG